MKYRMLSVVIPAYNERNTVGEVVRRVRQVELPADLDREIIVVDDGSNDGTDKVLQTIEDSTVRVVRHKTNRGQGAAIRSGLAVARGQVVLIQDADLEYDPSDIPRLVSPILDGQADVVFGSRFHPARSVMPLSSLLMDRGLSLATCLLYNTSLTDIETGYRAFDRNTIDSVTIDSDGFSYGPEITAKLQRGHARFFEVPVTYSGRVVGGKFGVRDRLQALVTLLRYRFKSVPEVVHAESDTIVDVREYAASVRR